MKNKIIIVLATILVVAVATVLILLLPIKEESKTIPTPKQPIQQIATTTTNISINSNNQEAALIAATSTIPTLTIASSTIKTYINDQYGFEFKYPGNWKIVENPYGSPYSQFNLIAVPASGKYYPDPIAINIVIPKFIDMEYADLQSVGIKEKINGIEGIRYEYENEGLPQLDIILPFNKYNLIIGEDEHYNDIFNEVTSTFTFFK
jgi:hypothetical protein